MLRIATLENHQRMPTQDLLLQIAAAVSAGETDFYISATGQHDIGGPLWNKYGKNLNFIVDNPGQRLGSMCLPGTTITVEGPAPADVGWLNSGGVITVKGDAGDTAGHCAAAGKIFIGGRAGTRSGSLMKHDPGLEPPQLWVLNSIGSFSFEFMSGGKAVICGHDSQTLPSVLGERPCVGMVGGVVYFRGPHGELPTDVTCSGLGEEDINWLNAGLDEFLESINQKKLKPELSQWKHWRKLEPAAGANKPERLTVAAFHGQKWLEGGLFGDIYPDDLAVEPLVGVADARLAIPCWQNGADACVDCRQCLAACPQAAIRRREDTGKAVYNANAQRCIGCGICQAICPASVWRMES